MIELYKVIQDGWKDRKELHKEVIRKYWTYRDELSMNDGLIFKGERVMIPLVLRGMVIEKLHYAHQGVQSCIRKARDTVFWPLMLDDIKRTIEMCALCIQYGSEQ